MMFATTTLTCDPAWPWSLPGIGLLLLLGVAAALALLTIWTYLGAGAPRRRVALILALRLMALAVACLLVLRPSLAFQEEETLAPQKLIILVDNSASMNFTDGFNNLSRWSTAQRILQAPAVAAALKRLASDQRVTIEYYQGAADIARLDLQGKADGKRTEIGQWLHALFELYGQDKSVSAVVLFSDGADNGTRFAALDEAARWRGGAALHPFAVGQPTTTTRQRDIAFVGNKIYVTPAPLHAKAKMTVRGYLNAPGFQNARVRLRLLLDGKELAAKNVDLLKTFDNEVQISGEAPAAPGEIKVTLKVDPLQDEVTAANNEISTYATVIKEGVKILWVEGRKRPFEPIFAIRYALAPDPRFQVFYAERLKEGEVAEDWFNFARQHYDVIVIGDISAARFADKDARVFSVIKELVEKKKTGLLMLGGNETFAGKDWSSSEAADLASVLPVELNEPGQVEGKVKVRPTERGLQYLLRLDDDQRKNEEIWEKHFAPLDGLTHVGRPRPTAEVLATNDGKDPVLVARDVGTGRSMVFGGDTTWRAWRRDPVAVQAYQRFWKQVMLWLAHQEDVGHAIRVTPDTRRLASGNTLGFSIEMVGKKEPKDVRFQVKVIAPDKREIELTPTTEDGKARAKFWNTDQPGEYRIVASVPGTKDTGEAKFLCYAEDLENLYPAADFDHLRKLAQAGGGKFHVADERMFLQFLDDVKAKRAESARQHTQFWPDWRRAPSSTSPGDQLTVLWNSTALPCFLLFCAFLCLEWYLRRRWGMV
jgi:uncharacterized membrane protein